MVPPGRQHASRTKAPKPVAPEPRGKPWIREIVRSDGRYSWTTYMLQGWRENGKWQRRQYCIRADAERELAVLQVRLLNEAVDLKPTVTAMSRQQVQEAENAFRRLKNRHSLDSVIDYFLRHHHDPESPVPLKNAITRFLDSKEHDGLQPRSVRQLECTLERFLEHLKGRSTDDREIQVHDISSADVTMFLESLRSRDGVHRAKRKTWNNSRLELSSFFSWACHESTRYCTENPVTRTAHFKKKQVEHQRGEIEVLSPETVSQLFEYLETFKEGRYCRYYALLLFAGLRPESEAERLAQRPDRNNLIDLKVGEIELPAAICPKSSGKRTVTIQPNLAAWLKAYPGDILPEKNVRRDLAGIRRKFGLSQDIARHTWFTYTIGRDHSVERAALQGGNSEAVIRDHYLSLSKRLGAQAPKFWGVLPKYSKQNVIRIDMAMKRKSA